MQKKTAIDTSLNPDVAIVLQNSVEIFCPKVSHWTYHVGIAFCICT